MPSIKSRRIFSLLLVAAGGIFLIVSIANTMSVSGRNIYSLLSKQGNTFILCSLFIAYCALNKSTQLFRTDIPCALSSLLLSSLMIISMAYHYLRTIRMHFYLSPFSVLAERPVYYITVFIILSFFFYLLFMSTRAFWFSDSIHVGKQRGARSINLIVTAAIYIAVLAFLYSPSFPYGVSPDTENQWSQLHGELQYNRIHAIGHTIFLKAILSIYDNYIAVILVHIAAVIIIYLLFSEYFCSSGISRPVIVFVFSLALLITCSYTRAYFSPWKDTPSAISLAVVCYILMRYLKTERISIAASIVLGLSLAGCMIFRLNGIVALAVCGIYFSISFIRRKYYPQLVSMLACIVLAISFVNIYAEKVMRPLDMENGFSIQVFGSGLAAMAKSGELSDEELNEIDKLVSVEWLENNYGIYIDKVGLIWTTDNSPEITADENFSIFNNRFVLDMGENKWEIVALYLKLMPRHFLVCVKDVIGSLYMMWNTSPVFLYSYAFCIVLLVYLSIKAKLRLREYAIFLPSACNTLSIMISTITNEERYLLPSFMLMPVYFLYILCKNKEHRKNKQELPSIVN